jgi:hypothetical protein
MVEKIMIGPNQIFGAKRIGFFPSPLFTKLLMKIIYVVGMLFLSMTFGCKEKTVTEKVVEKEVEVKVEKGADTQIKIGPDGGSVKTKKVEVEIKN